MEVPDHIQVLIQQFLADAISPEDHDELDAWVELSDENMLAFEQALPPLTKC